MLSVIRRVIGALLALQFAGMLGFDLWLWTGDLDIDKLPTDQAAMFLVGFAMELAGFALGIWLAAGRRGAAATPNAEDYRLGENENSK